MTTSARCHSEEQCDEESVLYDLRCHCEPVLTLAWQSPDKTKTYDNRFCWCLPAAVLSGFAQKVPKDATRGGVELLAPAPKATLPGTPPGAHFR